MRQTDLIAGALALAACPGGGGETGQPGAEDTSAAPSTSAPTTSDAGTSTGEPSTSTTTSGPDETTGPAEPAWCHGFDPTPPLRLAVRNLDGEDLLAGAPLRGVCGSQGLVMFPIYPEVGGYVPTGASLEIGVTIDVEGFNLDPTGHFYQGVERLQVDCADTGDTNSNGYPSGYLSVFPPDNIPDVLAVDGEPGTLHVQLQTTEGPLAVDGDIVLAIAAADAECGY